jgi:hypothetical protein
MDREQGERETCTRQNKASYTSVLVHAARFWHFSLAEVRVRLYPCVRTAYRACAWKAYGCAALLVCACVRARVWLS